VVSDLGAVGALDSDVGRVLRAELLTIGADPLLGRGLLVDLVELVLVGSCLVGGLGGGGCEDVSSDEAEVIEDLSELGVGNEEGNEHSQVRGGWN